MGKAGTGTEADVSALAATSASARLRMDSTNAAPDTLTSTDVLLSQPEHLRQLGVGLATAVASRATAAKSPAALASAIARSAIPLEYRLRAMISDMAVWPSGTGLRFRNRR